jgi:cellulose synthase operon protein YhjU
LYYNTISLHDGNKLPSGDNSMRTYPRRAGKLLDDIDRFFDLLETSGRKVVVVIVPEHGAALHGDGVQIAGMREIPTPQITLAPVGVKFIGMSADERQHVVNQSTSYLALASLLSNTLQQYQENTALNVDALVKNLPETPYVAENESLAVMKYGANYYSRNSEGVWIKNEK